MRKEDKEQISIALVVVGILLIIIGGCARDANFIYAGAFVLVLPWVIQYGGRLLRYLRKGGT